MSGVSSVRMIYFKLQHCSQASFMVVVFANPYHCPELVSTPVSQQARKCSFHHSVCAAQAVCANSEFYVVKQEARMTT